MILTIRRLFEPQMRAGLSRTAKLGLTPVVLVMALTLISGPIQASEQPLYVDKFRDWSLYSYEVDQGKVCYIASRPTKEEGDYTRRGPAAVLVSRWPIDESREQVSVQPGYNYLSDSLVSMKIDGTEFELFTKGEHAWASTTDQDAQIIQSMKKGQVMAIRGTSTKKTYSLDSYSLLGFTAAYQAMQDVCK